MIRKSVGIAMMMAACLFAGGQTPGGVSTSLTGWFKANTPTAANLVLNNGNVSQWKSETGTYTASQATASRQPAFVNTAGTATVFNFNPSVQFQVSAQKSLNNTSSSPDLLGAAGTAFIVVNTNNYNGNSSSCFAYTANGSNRYQVKAHFRIQTGNAGTGYTADFTPQFPTAYGNAAGRILTSSGTGPGFYSKRNGEQFAINNTAALYNPSVSTGLCIGSNNNGGGGEYSNSAIAEVITYSTQLSNADVNKIESYLAIKYGITLQSPAGPVNYVASGGATTWDATTNTSYNNNITGIGRDDAAGLVQKQSLSVNNDRLVSLYNGNSGGVFPAMNTDNATTFAADQSFLIFGDDGQNLALGACLFAGKMPRINRTWKVQQTGTNGPVTLSVNTADVSPFIKYLVVSANPAFPAGATAIYPLQTSGSQLYRSLTLNNGEYFSFATDSLIASFTMTQPTCANPAGGSITANINNGTPFTDFTWSTNPVQTGLTATGLGAGTYTFSATFPGSSCVATFPAGTIQAATSFALSVSASLTSICQGSSSTLVATIAGGGTGTFSYQWAPGGQTTPVITVSPTDTTKYYLTVTYGACSKTDSITVNVKPKPTASFTALPAAVCLGDTNTITYTGNAMATATYSWNGFAGATVLSGTGAGPYKIKFAAAGNYVIRLQVTQNGCVSNIETQTVTVQAPPTGSFAVLPATICLGDTNTVTYTGNASATATYNWNGFAGATVLSGTGAGPYKIQFATAGSYVIRLQVTQNGCTSNPETQTVNVNLQPTALFSALPAAVCLGDTNTITYTGNAAANATYNWNGFAGATVLSGTGAGPYKVKFAAAGSYIIQLQVAQNGCTSSPENQMVTVQAPPTVSFTALPASICSGDTVAVNFTGNAPATATYNWAWGGGTVVSGTNAGPYRVRFINSGSIGLSVTNGLCTVAATAQPISVTPRPVASFTLSDSTGCDDLDIIFNNTSQNGTAWRWNLGDGTTSTDSIPVPKTYATGIYPVTLTATNGQCSNTSATHTIRVVAGPTASFTAAPAAGVPVQLSQANFLFTNASTNATSYRWLFGDNNTSVATNPLHTYNATGSFIVSLIAYNTLGCADTLSQSPFVVVADSLLQIPNAFSPNGDGINDRWVINGLRGYPNSRINIFNRWGQAVFSSIGYNAPWDGTYGSKPLPIGTYYYTIVANNRSYTGPITLLR